MKYESTSMYWSYYIYLADAMKQEVETVKKWV